MYLLDTATDPPKAVRAVIELVTVSDAKKLTQKDFSFNWRGIEEADLWKLRLEDSKEILGLLALIDYPSESRLEIKLIASRIDNVESSKQYDRIAGCLIAWACRLSLRKYGAEAAVSLIPKTTLARHYQVKYNMAAAGRQLYLDGSNLYGLIQTYIDNEP